VRYPDGSLRHREFSFGGWDTPHHYISIEVYDHRSTWVSAGGWTPRLLITCVLPDEQSINRALDILEEGLGLTPRYDSREDLFGRPVAEIHV